MAKKKKSERSSGGVMVGLSADDLRRELESSSGSRDQSMLFLSDGAEAEVSFVSAPDEWVRFQECYDGKGYYIVEGDEACDSGSRPSVRVLCAIYVHRLFRPQTKKFPASRMKDVGYRYFKLNAETAQTLLKIHHRRNTLADRIYTIEREGGDTTTKYIVDRTDKKVPPKTTSGWKGKPGKSSKNLVFSQYKKMLESQRGNSSEDDDDEFDLDDDYLDALVGGSKKSKKSKKKSR